MVLKMPGLPGYYMQKVRQMHRKRKSDGLERAEEFIKAGFVS